MWQMRRVRLDRVGAPASRFLNVTIDLDDDGGFPLDTIIWLRNGGGKSSVLSLMCALIRPHRRDFLASSSTDKHLEDYVLGSDTAHVTIEWSGPAGRRLVTGAVYEWADRIQPADPNRDHDKLQARWYAFTPVPGRAELELLAFADANEQPLPLKEFAAAVRSWDAIPDCRATVTDGQDRWARVLDDHGLDPELLTAILQMNATEGGIEGQFQFRNADQFVRYLLELIIDPEVPREVSGILEKVRAKLAERPAVLADLAFAEEAVPQLRRLVQARNDHQAADRLLVDARSAADELRESLVAAAQRAAAAGADAAAAEKSQRDRLLAERRARDVAYNRSVEFRRIAATYRQGAAAGRRAELEQERDAAQQELDAWQAVPRLHALAAAKHRVRELEAQLRAATADAEPLRRARDEAAAAFAAALDAAIAELAAQVEEAEQRRAEQSRRAGEAKQSQTAKAAERGRKESRLESLSEQLVALDAELAAAVADSLLFDDEEIAAALDRRRFDDSAARQQLETTAESRRRLQVRREELGGRERDLRVTRTGLERDHQATEERLRALRGRVEALAADERLQLLAGSDDIDVLAEADDLVALLTEQITRGDQRQVEIAVEGAEDERAAAALNTTGLLPPVLDLALALAECEKAQIAVTSGWSYLADAVPAHLRGKVLAAAPALAGGVLVHNPDDLPAAQQLLTTAALRPTSPVAVATTADLHAVVEQVGIGGAALVTFVVPTAPALTDRAAAGEELGLRDLARGERVSEATALEQQRSVDDELRRALRKLLADCPSGTLTALEVQIADLEDRLADVDAQLGAVPGQRGALDAEAAALDEQERTAQRTRRAAANAIGKLTGLQPRLAAAQAQRAEADALPGEISALTTSIREAEEAEEAARTAVRTAEDDVRTRRELLRTYRKERSELGDGFADVEPPESLEQAREAWQVAAAAYRKETSESVLAAAVEEAHRSVSRPAAEVAQLAEQRRIRAEALAATPVGANERLTADAIRDAEAKLARLRHELNEATVELRLAEEEVQHHTPTDRNRRIQLDDAEVPATREATLEAAAAADAEREEHLAAENDAQAKIGEAVGQKAAAEKRADAMRSSGLLLGGSRDDTVGDAVEPYAGSAEQAGEDVDRLREGLTMAQQLEAQASRELAKVSAELTRWANDDRFQQVKPDVRGRFRVTDAAAELGPGAAELADQLNVYAANLRGHLDELEEHKRFVVTAMTGMVRQALRTIERAQRLSELPESMGQWAGQRFLEVAPRSSVDTSESIVRDRCSRLVDSLTSRGAEVPRGLELLWQATSAVVGDGNWKARVLKPSTTFALDRVSVEKMRKWSGGEKVTISLLLFCMVAKLRAQNRGRELPGLGVLPLDNPLGKANYVVFLDLQRKVASANGVQLLFLTGVGDMKAVGRFPNVVRMRNTANKSREYVRVAERIIADDDPAGVVDSTRVWRDDPVLKLL
jgi:hypothetical protein